MDIHHDLEEKIGIRRIKIRRTDAPSVLIVGSFTSADTAIKQWVSNSKRPVECEFRIFYHDGAIFAGWLSAVNARGKQSTLTGHLRSIVRCIDRADNSLDPIELKKLEGDDSSPRCIPTGQLLQRYEINDFGMNISV